LLGKGKQLASSDKLVTTDKLPRCVLGRKWLIFNNSMSRTNIGTGKAKGPGRHRATKRGAGKKRNEVVEEGAALTEAVTFHGGQVQTNN
jgi:hypothetical protein